MDKINWASLNGQEMRCLNVNKIKDLEDVKRILKFMNIEVAWNECTQPIGFDEVKDLFE